MSRRGARLAVCGLLAALACGCGDGAQRGAAAHAAVDAPAPAMPAAPDPARAQRLAAWNRLGFGMFVHWGLYSELGGVWNGAPVTTGYSEQIQGWAKIPPADYARVAARFSAPAFDADAICGLAQDAGARYIVVTAKHHDGFAMFDTATTDYDIVQRTPFGRDPLKLLSDACRRRGLGFGVYFSLVDWHAGHAPETEHNSNPIPAAMEPLIERQLRELMTRYGPIAEVWFDMSAPTPEQSRRFATIVRELQPQAAINGRIWNNAGDFVTLGDNEAPPPAMQPPFEVPASIYHATWGYRSWQRRDDAPGKVRELANGLVQARAAGGNYLLNIGPKGDGGVVPFEAQVLRGIGDWLRRHPGVAAARPAGLPPQAWGAAMRSGDDLLLFVRDWRPGELVVAGLASEPGTVRIDGDGGAAPLRWRRRGDDLVVELPAQAPDPVLPVLRIGPGATPLRAAWPDTVAVGAAPVRLPFAQWRPGTSFAFGNGYLTQRATTVRLDAHLALAQARTLGLRLHGLRADDPQRRYRLSAGEAAVEASAAALADGSAPALALPAAASLTLRIALAAPTYPAEDLGLRFDSAELTPGGTTP